jgi:hypothetical protein
VEWYKVDSGLSQAVEGALVLAIVCPLVALLARGLWLFLVHVVQGVSAVLGLG